jgi:hypothetical protein
MNRFTEHSQVVTTRNYNDLKIAVIITHEIGLQFPFTSRLVNMSQLNP